MSDRDKGDEWYVGPAVQRAVEAMAKELLSVDLAGTRKHLTLEKSADQIELKSEQVEKLRRTVAYRQLSVLAAAARDPEKGPYPIGAALYAATEFYAASGMAYRQLELSSRLARNEDALDRLMLWLAPSTSHESPALGRDSMIGTDRERLRQVASFWFRLGTRCQWFEKMLVEALVAAEGYAAAQEFKQNPVFYTGKTGLGRAFVWAWVYEKSKGASPKHEILLSAANFLLGLAGVAVVGGIAWYSSSLVDTGSEVTGYLGLILCAWIALNWVGRFATRLVLSWATTPGNFRAGHVQEMRWDLDMACRAVSPLGMSLHAASRALQKCNGIDQIAVGLVERGLAAGEVMWFSYRCEDWDSPDVQRWLELLSDDDDGEPD